MSASLTPRLNVLISGAGIAGPCLAYWLTRTRLNANVTIVERSPTPRPTGQSIDVRGPAVDVVRKMGLEQVMRACHTTEEGTVMVDRQGKQFAFFPSGETFTADYEILRADLSRLFLDATKDRAGIEYVYGDHIRSVDQTEDCVNVVFDSGTRATYDVLVAADGSSSKTRPMILDEQTLKNSYNPLGQYIAFFSIPSQPGDPKLWQWYNTPKGLSIMLRPHRTGKTMGVYLCVTLPANGQLDPNCEEALHAGVAAQKHLLRTIFATAGWQADRVLDGMDASDDFYMSRAAQVRLPRWVQGRATVLGDAAHATFGIGTSLAIEGAYLLAGELSKIQTPSGEDVPAALERFEAVFRPFYRTVEQPPPFYPQAAFPQTRWALGLRDFFLRLVSVTKAYKLLPGDKVEWTLPEYEWEPDAVRG